MGQQGMPLRHAPLASPDIAGRTEGRFRERASRSGAGDRDPAKNWRVSGGPGSPETLLGQAPMQAAKVAGSTLPPLSTTATVLPFASTLPANTAASGVTPPGSTTSFSAS